MIRRLFNNKAFVIGLAACAGLYMVYSITAPMLDEPDFSDVEAPAFDPDDTQAELEVVATAAEPQKPAEEVWRAGQSVLSGQLTWNGRPNRDPFAGLRVASPVSAGSEPAEPRAVAIICVPRLDALVAGPNSLFAVLNDQIVREGDLISGYQVTRISPDGVRVSSRFASHWLAVADMEIEATSESDDREQFDTGLEDFSGEPDAPPDAGAPGA